MSYQRDRLIRARHRYSEREILLDVWVVTEYQGEPVGLDGQALRWCTRADLPAAKLLPADRPIVTALRLPERLTQPSGADYAVGDAAASPTCANRDDAATGPLLRGVYCASKRQALAAAAAGADFLVLREPLAQPALAALCDSVRVPVYASGMSLEAAWGAGAIGISEL